MKELFIAISIMNIKQIFSLFFMFVMVVAYILVELINTFHGKILQLNAFMFPPILFRSKNRIRKCVSCT